MKKTAGHILKGSDVKLEGQFHLDLGQVAPVRAKEKSVASVTPQAQIVENYPEFAVIEITCSCGTKTYLRCEYAGAESSADQRPDETKQESDQTK